ncbi:spore coat protein [Paenibacillus sp. RC67]|uniref:spore coat protein n=1 Tax=Paenibacillus sp. RC67 TaxID=3039392 RepID=UPI0024AD37C9|nr:spore coat protein [Paenibacillus sp. RC67]
MYQQQNFMNQSTHQHTPLQEQDWGNLVLSELKRTAREYTTAALEATHPAIRQTFQSLSQRTMQEQAELFQVLSQLNGYGSVKMANQQEIQQDLQQQVQKVEQLQSIVQQSIQSANTNTAAMYQQQQQHQPMYNASPQYQQQQQPSFNTYDAGGFGGAAAGSYQQPSTQGGQSYGQSFATNFSSSVGSHSPNQSQSYTSDSGSGSSGISQNQNPTTQSIANQYTASAFKSTAGNGSIGQSSGTSANQWAQEGGAAKYGSNQDSYSAISASSSQGGNSFNWTDDSANASSSAITSTSNRGGNSFEWHDSDEQANASSSLSSSQERSTSFSGGKFM